MQIKHRFTGETILAVEGENLRGANLRGANLRRADLLEANLRWADLRGADLRGADLSGADLRWADLRGADLRGADLSGADLRGADLVGVAEILGIDLDDKLAERVLAQITEHPESHDQTTWHSSCGGKHCVAGWATVKAGALGRYLDAQLGTLTAATLLLWRPGLEMPSFASDATDDETIGRLRRMAAALAAKGGA